MQIQNNINHKVIGTAVATSSLLALTMLLCPVAPHTHAVTDNYDDAISKQDLSTVARLWNKPTLAVALDNMVTMEVTPTSTGSFVSSTANLTVETNSVNGLRVLMNGVHGNTLNSNDQNISAAIQPLASTATPNNFGDNTWGYYIGEANVDNSTTYAPVPATTTEVFSTDTSGSTQTYNVAFGAKINSSLPAGVYGNSVLVSAVVNPIVLTTLTDIEYMQDMTTEICMNTPIGATAQLEDSRDSSHYWVARLKDGRCWMTQNLAFYINEDNESLSSYYLSPSETDITQNWSSSSKIPPTTTRRNLNDTLGGNGKAYSFGFPAKVIATPANPATQWCSAYSTDFADCTKYGVVDVSNWQKFKATYTATTNGSWTYSDGTKVNSTIVAVNCTEWSNNVCTAGTYDSHYLIGNYYTWYAATAGNGDAGGSICPKGWTLPTSSTEQSSGSFYGLLSKYGLTTSPTGSADGSNYNIASAPLYFMRNGYMDSDSLNYISGVNYTGTFYTNSISSAGDTEFLSIDGDKVIVNQFDPDGYARSVRCVNNPNI